MSHSKRPVIRRHTLTKQYRKSSTGANGYLGKNTVPVKQGLASAKGGIGLKRGCPSWNEGRVSKLSKRKHNQAKKATNVIKKPPEIQNAALPG